MNLTQWKERLKPGMKLLCTYRHWWTQPPLEVIGNLGKTTVGGTPPADGKELCEIKHVRATQMTYSTPTKPLIFMDYPRASELKADDTGFELYFPDKEEFGDRRAKLMSRYLWFGVVVAILAGSLVAESKYYIKATHVGPGAVAVSCTNGADPTILVPEKGRIQGNFLLVTCGN